MTTYIRLTGGTLGDGAEAIYRCDMSQASDPIQYWCAEDEEWYSTQYQCADARHDVSGLASIAQRDIDADTHPDYRSTCDWDDISDTPPDAAMA